MKFLKACSVLFFMIVSLSWCSVMMASPTEASVVGVRQGDSAAYVGAPPSEEYEWIQISVSQIRGNVVDLSMRYDVRSRFRSQGSYSYPDHLRLFSIDVAEGTSNYFFFLVPRNLTIGDAVPVPQAYPPLKVEGVEHRIYAGAERTIVFASFSNMTVSAYEFKTAGRYYWDKDTGLLVEMVATIGNMDVTCEKLTGTSLWSADLRYWLADNYPILITLAFVIGVFSAAAVLMLRLRNRMTFKVTRPNTGKALLVAGVALGAGGILSLSSFGQLVSSLCFAFAPSFLVGGVLAYTGGWATMHKNKIVPDVGILLIAAAIVLGGIVFACATYRHLEVFVPYVEAEPYGSMDQMRPEAYTSLDGVFFYPYSWLSSIISTVAVCLATLGVAYKISQRF